MKLLQLIIYKYIYTVSLVLFSFAVYFTGDGKTKVNLFFKATECLQISKLTIMVISAIIRSHKYVLVQSFH
jgi:hypothetical protein